MSWLTTYGDDNKVTDGASTRVERLGLFAGTTAHAFERTVSESKYRYISMTQEAAETARSELIAAAAETPGLNRTATLQKQNDAGAYAVEIIDIQDGAWAEP
jgi:heme oxygenase